MPTVYRTKRSRYGFHRTKDCPQIKTGAYAVELSELTRAIPCRVCYRDAPRNESAHRFCRQCNNKIALPCEHNGGILVDVVKVRRKPTLFSDPGDTWIQPKYVWPEYAHMYKQ